MSFFSKLFGSKEKQASTSGSFPDEIMSNVYWAFYGGEYSSEEEFIKTVKEYNEKLNNKCNLDQVVIQAKEITIQYEYWSEDGEDEIETDFNLIANGEAFKAGELLYLIHNKVVKNLENDDHHFFEGLMLNKNEDVKNNIPSYFILLGS